jgi:hypothetical protein
MSKSVLRSFVFISTTVLLSRYVAMAAGTGSSAQAPALYDTFQPPSSGGTYEDPVFGTTIKRVSAAMTMTDNASRSGLTTIGTEYSTASPFNSDGSRLILQHNSYFGLYNGNGDYLRDLPFAAHTSSEPRWSRTDPNVLYFVNGNSLKKLEVASGAITNLRTFSEYGSISGMGESDISRDGDHFVFAGDRRHVFVYEISSGTKGQTLDTSGHSFNNLYITPNNSVALGWLANGSGRYNGVELFDRNMNFQRQLTHAIGHQHLTRDTNGDDVLIWNNSNDAQPIACQNGIVKVRLSDARQTCLLELDWSLAVHITAGDGDGWAFVETYAPSDPFPQSSNWAPYTNEILQVKLDGSETRRLLHHRSRPHDSYVYQPKVSVSRDGSKLAFTSNQNLQQIQGYPSTYSDAYFVNVPGSATPPAPSDPNTPAPTPTPAPQSPPPTPPAPGTPAPTPTPAPQAPTGTLTAVTHEQDNPAVAYTGSWAKNGLPSHSGGSAYLAMDAGARATFTFSGKGASWVGYRDEWSGTAIVRVDGVIKGTVDTASSPGQPRATLYSISGLSNGSHTLTIEATGTRGAGSAGSWVWVDGFSVIR